MSDTATGSHPPGTLGGAAGTDWPAETADTIERFVDTIRSKTTEPAERAVRVLVYGLVAAVLGVVALVLVVVALVRALDLALPGEVWSAHLLLGAILTLAGLLLWSKRTPKDARRD
jgi:predicted metal-binding membrane protein